MLEFIGIHKKKDKKTSTKNFLIVSKTVQPVLTQEDNFWQVFLLHIYLLSHHQFDYLERT